MALYYTLISIVPALLAILAAKFAAWGKNHNRSETAIFYYRLTSVVCFSTFYWMLGLYVLGLINEQMISIAAQNYGMLAFFHISISLVLGLISQLVIYQHDTSPAPKV